jgi:hypothetical protein
LRSAVGFGRQNISRVRTRKKVVARGGIEPPTQGFSAAF